MKCEKSPRDNDPSQCVCVHLNISYGRVRFLLAYMQKRCGAQQFISTLKFHCVQMMAIHLNSHNGRDINNIKAENMFPSFVLFILI